MILNVKHISFFIVYYFIFSTLCFAKMAPPKHFDVKNLILEVEAIQQSRKLTEQENQKMFILNFVKDIFGINEFDAYIHGPVKTAHIVIEIEKAIYYRGLWTKKITKEKINRINKDKEVLSKIFKSDSVSWAWIQKSLGNNKKAKSIFNKLFQDQYKLTLNLKEAIYGPINPGPLGYSKYVLKYLIELSTDKEQSKLKEQLRKMKVHISKIPQSKIVT